MTNGLGGPSGPLAVVGADVGSIETLANAFQAAADELRAHQRSLTISVRQARWIGRDAERHRAAWLHSLAPIMAETAAFVDRLRQDLDRQAAEQRSASGSWPSVTDAPNARLRGFRSGFSDDIEDALDRFLTAAGSAQRSPIGPSGVTGLRPARFGPPPTARQAVVAALEGLAHEHRIRRDEIEVRALDSGRYIVVLPGVTDLSDGVAEFVGRLRDAPFDVAGAGRDAVESWADNDAPTVRKMRYAFEAAVRDDVSDNEYSTVALDALRRAGVPPGAEVMLVGHSFGAYAAVDIAADPAVNAAHGADPDGFHVDVTHVIAAGAETDWRFDELPPATRALVLNNRVDAVYRAEDVLHRDGDAELPGHVEHNFWGGWSGAGHDERHYIDRVADDNDAEVAQWLDDAGRAYGGGGLRVSVRVPDPHQ